MTDHELTFSERSVLEALYNAEKAGESPLNDAQLSILTGLSIKSVKKATLQLQEYGFIEWNRHAVH